LDPGLDRKSEWVHYRQVQLAFVALSAKRESAKEEEKKKQNSFHQELASAQRRPAQRKLRGPPRLNITGSGLLFSPFFALTCRNAKTSGVTWHTLRRTFTFAAGLMNSGVDIVVVKELLGRVQASDG
jgi:integrase